MREGPVFEAIIMNKEKNNPDYRYVLYCCTWLCVGLASDLDGYILYSFAHSLLSQVPF